MESLDARLVLPTRDTAVTELSSGPLGAPVLEYGGEVGELAVLDTLTLIENFLEFTLSVDASSEVPVPFEVALPFPLVNFSAGAALSNGELILVSGTSSAELLG